MRVRQGWSLDFHPQLLRAARLRVVELHPGTATSPPEVAGRALLQLRDRIAMLAGDEAGLRTLAYELNGSQLRGLIGGLARWEELRPSALFVLRCRLRSSQRRTAWMTWQFYPGVHEVGELLVELGERFGWDLMAGPGWAEAVEAWARSPTPGIQIQGWLDAEGLSYSNLDELAGLPLQKDTPLTRAVRDAVMTHGSRSQLEAEGATKLLGWLKELSPERRMAFGQNYLRTIPLPQWEPKILERLRASYGSPKDGREAFWNSVAPELRQAFHRWFLERELRKALGQDSRRHRYWRRWLDELTDITLSAAGGTEYAILYFKRFAVIEFFELGNAAYFYTHSQLKQVLRSRIREPRDLKTKHYTRRGGPWATDNRLIHSGNWETKADSLLRAWRR